MQDETALTISREIQNLNPTLDRKTKAQHVNKNEQPHHRLVLELYAKGMGRNEIAAATGLSPNCVSNCISQPRAQQLLVNRIVANAAEVDKKVSELVMVGAEEGAKLLLETIKDASAKRSDRITAAQEFLNRRYGKPNQPVNREGDVNLNDLSIAEVAAQLPKSQTATTEQPALAGSETQPSKPTETKTN